MTNKQAAKILQDGLLKGIENDKEFPKETAEVREALALAIAALKNPLLDYEKAGAKGGAATHKKYGRKQASAWGKMGGRPKKTSDILDLQGRKVGKAEFKQ